MSLPSASKLQLTVTCPASAALPAVRFAHPAGEDGQELHALLAAALDARKVGVEHVAPETAQEWLDGVLEAVGDRLDHGVSEVAYGYDPMAGRAWLFGSHLGRHYPERPTPTTVFGTVDYVREMMTPGRWLAVDLKTGEESTPVQRHWQMRFAALAVAGWHGAESVQVAILHAPRDGRRAWWEWGPTWDALDLVPFREELAETLRALEQAKAAVKAGRTPRLTQGPHCSTCPTRLSCPAQTALVRAWATKPQETKAELHHLLDVETAGLAWARIQAAKAAIAEAERQVYAFASVQPIPLPGGQMLGKHRRRGRDVADAEKAWPLLVERYGVEAAREAMSLKTSRTALRKAAEVSAPRGRKREVGDAFVRELETLGVISEKWSEDVGVFDPTDSETQSAQSALAGAAGASPPPAQPVLSAGEGQEQRNG